METTLSILEKQIVHRLNGVDHYESINIDKHLAQLLDSYDIPEEAKLACLTIDTAMHHLDELSTTLTSKKSILIGDLLSAHFYTLLAKLNDPIYQKEISGAIVVINEIKSSIHHETIFEEDISTNILTVESIFPRITIKHFAPDANLGPINEKVLTSFSEKHPSYLSKFSKDELNTFLDRIESEIHSKRGN